MGESLMTGRRAGVHLIRLVEECERFDFAVAWSTDNDLTKAIWKNRRKIGHAVFGTHMFRTEPEVLEKFMSCPQAKYVSPKGGLFHPKLYWFLMQDRTVVVIGSHNLTRGAFEGRNVELSAVLELAHGSPLLASLRIFMSDAWTRAERIDEDFLYSYRAQYRIHKQKNLDLQDFEKLSKPQPEGNGPAIVDLDWTDFVRRVRAERYFRDRLEVVTRVGQLFGVHGTFAKMDLTERKAVAGTFRKGEATLDGLEWGWFGSMSGQGDFKNLVNENPRSLSIALDRIPATGPVSQDHYDEFRALFLQAFRRKEHEGGPATASRLLAMKRPDSFVPINQGNRVRLCRAVGCAPTTLTLENYWSRIIVPAQLSVWWNAPRPASPEAAHIWDRRAAMLDCLYYQVVRPKRRSAGK